MFLVSTGKRVDSDAFTFGLPGSLRDSVVSMTSTSFLADFWTELDRNTSTRTFFLVDEIDVQSML